MVNIGSENEKNSIDLLVVVVLIVKPVNHLLKDLAKAVN